MAKRRKEKDEEEEKPFKMPKFDEEAFLKKEKRNIKSTFISFLFGIFMALICFGFWVLIGNNPFRWELILLVGLVNAIFLRQIFVRLNLDLTDFGRKNWFGSYAIYFISWLVVLIVLVNPPLYDDQSPKIELVVFPEYQEAGGDVMILAKITDNSGIEKSDIFLKIDGISINQNNFEFVDNIFTYTYEGPEILEKDETHSFELSAVDSGDNTQLKQGSFTFSNDTITIATPDPGDRIRVADDIKFSVKADVWRFYYTVEDNDIKINATKDPTREEFYVTSTEFIGWDTGDNITVRPAAELVYNFENHFQKNDEGEVLIDKNQNPIPYFFINYINDTESYDFDVVNESSVGKTPIEEIDNPKAKVVAAPGFETIILIISIVLAFLIIKYKKKEKRNKK